MSPNLESAARTLDAAKFPEDVFGLLAGSQDAQKDALAAAYRKLVTMLHPDRYAGTEDEPEATRLFTALNRLKAAAETSIMDGTYGARKATPAAPAAAGFPLTIEIGKKEYVLTELAHAGDLADLYCCPSTVPDSLVKVALNAGDNDLLAREADNLRKLYPEKQDDVNYYRYLPRLLATFALKGKTGAARRANVLAEAKGYATLAEVVAAYQDGLDFRDMAWMWKRCLAALGFIHREGFVHGALTPVHILIDPIGHGAKLVDWCYSVTAGARVPAMVATHSDYYAPEIKAKLPATGRADIYMVAKCMVRILGGDPATGAIPPSVPRPVAGLLRACMIEAPARRPEDAWGVHDQFDEVLRQLIGKPKYRPLAMPA